MNMNRKFYRQIAKKHGVSVAEVKRDMRDAISETYKNPNAAALAVPRKDDVPTPEELVEHVAQKIRSGRA